ncbi:hypothetical protein HAU38_05600 [Weissella confusa]|uniref:hypothetical protein n=1 Tax=Weissella confusa TaxID=1583 RepID=UPI0018F250AF|nr:hypothetical protein [Weissella confusa]MBJ7675624.1 hypothetical protein [Weissella confusa]
MLKENVIFQNILYVAQIASYLVSIFGIVGIYITVQQFKNKAQKDNEAEMERKVLNSMNVMSTFAKELIPQISSSRQKVKAEYNKVVDEVLQEIKQQVLASTDSENMVAVQEQLKSINESSLDEKTRKSLLVQAKGHVGFISIFNQLEQLSAYMNYGLVVEDMVYPGLHKVLIKVVDENVDLFDSVRSDEAPYKELTTLYEKWKNKQEYESVDKEKKELENKLEKLQQAAANQHRR